VISTHPAVARDRRLAIGAAAVSLVFFAAAAPFAKLALPAIPAFLPAYGAALVVTDLLAAVLLYGQAAISRSRALLVLATAYLFSALMATAHALSFPGLFLPEGALGAGPQTTAWLYFLWHGAFALMVGGYALTRTDRAPLPAHARFGARVAASVAIALAAAVALVLAATAGHDALPAIMRSDRDADAKVYVAVAVWLIALAALPLLWRRRPRTVLDLWLGVALLAWIFDVALAAVLNGGRYDLGWYAGRVYGLLAGGFVLVMLLLENLRHFAELARVREAEARRARESLARHRERLRILHAIDLSILEGRAPGDVAGAVIQPLRELLGVARAIVNVFDLEKGEVEWLAAAGRQRTHVGPGIRYSIRMMGDVEALRRGEPQVLDTAALPPGPEVEALLASGVRHYMVVPMIAGGELIGALSFGGAEPEFPDEQVAIAREVAAQMAITLTQARLLERLRRQAEELEQRVQERTAELAATNRELEAFSYSVSHDLRAPLRAIDGYALMLAEDYEATLDAEGRRLLGVVRAEATRMGQLIDDLLEFSRTSRVPVRVAPVDMRSLAAEVVATLAPAYPAARVELAALPEARGDSAMLRQVWSNLVGNALKYSAKVAAPRVEIGGNASAREAEYWVRDNGAGFDMAYAGKLFQPFQRLHGSHEFPGEGIGLATLRRIVERHGGRAWASAAPDQGACFYFTLGAAATP